jgi:hypothetical protein
MAATKKATGPLTAKASIRQDRNGANSLFVNVHNVSKLPVRAYVLNVSFTNPVTGEPMRHVAAVKLPQTATPTYLQPQARWHSKIKRLSYLPSGEVASYHVGVDFVAFADGTSWGPLKFHRSQDLQRWLKGVDAVPGLHTPF